MAALLNFLAPTLFILCFYLLLAIMVWTIIHPPRLQFPHLPLPSLPLRTNFAAQKLTAQNLINRLPKDPLSRQTLRFSLILALVGIAGLLFPFPLPLRLLAAQALGAALLLPWFDHYHQQRQGQTKRTELLNALRSPVAQVAQAALLNAQQQGWHTDGTLANQDFSQAQWAGANLSGANLAGSNLANANLVGVNLRHANLEGAICTNALLATADLTGAILVGAQLNRIQAKAANFHRAMGQSVNLDGAKLQSANLTYANLHNSTLTQANLKQALLVGVELKGATFDTATKWPKHFYPNIAGAKFVAPQQASAQARIDEKMPAQKSAMQNLPEHRGRDLR